MCLQTTCWDAARALPFFPQRSPPAGQLDKWDKAASVLSLPSLQGNKKKAKKKSLNCEMKQTNSLKRNVLLRIQHPEKKNITVGNRNGVRVVRWGENKYHFEFDCMVPEMGDSCFSCRVRRSFFRLKESTD
eukprot:TRINITY_DN7338_c4_g1_i1.p1 TRINITY_DN7338_c4_g1~~TRINITY_DN7338_c4_g1_i1.p1  ORF type:complete len:131 (-),score=7.44 TRINITY_DN7338_c4_g1_i1:575-967(-)